MRLVAFGEVMLRLSPPGRELLLQRPSLDVWVAGAEANVATALARLGHQTRLVTTLPDNALGDAALASLRSHGIDCSGVLRRAGRMATYYVVSGASLRPTEVIYDRAHSAFVETPPTMWAWDDLLDGAECLLLSGITPALGPNGAAAALAGAEAANRLGVPVAFDGNYRAKLWRDGVSDPKAVLTELIAHADILFGNHRDATLLLGRDFSGDGPDRRREAATALFATFPRLRHIASTARHIAHVDHHRLAARVDARDGGYQTEEIEIAGIVDRVGTGDAFAAGVLHGLQSGGGPKEAARSGLALAALKHSIPGDACLFNQADLAAFSAIAGDVRR